MMRSWTVLLALTWFAGAVSAENWPGFRGPTGQGISAEKGLPVRWSRDQNVSWTAEIPGIGWSSPGMVFSSSGFPTPVGRQQIYPAIRAFKLGGKGDVTKSNLVWEQKKFVPMIPSLLWADHLLYSVKEDGQAMCMDDSDGKILWHQRLEGTYSASPFYADQKIYFPNDSGNTTVIEAGREFKQIAFNELNEPCQASIAASDGRLFIRTENHLYCISTASESKP